MILKSPAVPDEIKETTESEKRTNETDVLFFRSPSVPSFQTSVMLLLNTTRCVCWLFISCVGLFLELSSADWCLEVQHACVCSGVTWFNSLWLNYSVWLYPGLVSEECCLVMLSSQVICIKMVGTVPQDCSWAVTLSLHDVKVLNGLLPSDTSCWSLSKLPICWKQYAALSFPRWTRVNPLMNQIEEKQMIAIIIVTCWNKIQINNMTSLCVFSAQHTIVLNLLTSHWSVFLPESNLWSENMKPEQKCYKLQFLKCPLEAVCRKGRNHTHIHSKSGSFFHNFLFSKLLKFGVPHKRAWLTSVLPVAVCKVCILNTAPTNDGLQTLYQKHMGDITETTSVHCTVYRGNTWAESWVKVKSQLICLQKNWQRSNITIDYKIWT